MTRGIPIAADRPLPGRRPDLLDLYGVLAEAGLDLATAAAAIYAARADHSPVIETPLATARTAVARVLRTLAEYDDRGDEGRASRP